MQSARTHPAMGRFTLQHVIQVEVTMVSEFGVSRTHAFPDPDALAHALVRALEAAPDELRRPFREFRVGPKSELLLLTWQFWEAQQAAGTFQPNSARIPLPTCMHACP